MAGATRIHRCDGQPISCYQPRLSAVISALIEMLVDRQDYRRSASAQDRKGRQAPPLIRAIPYQDPQQEAERFKAVHGSGQDRPQGLSPVAQIVHVLSVAEVSPMIAKFRNH